MDFLLTTRTSSKTTFLKSTTIKFLTRTRRTNDCLRRGKFPPSSPAKAHHNHTGTRKACCAQLRLGHTPDKFFFFCFHFHSRRREQRRKNGAPKPIHGKQKSHAGEPGWAVPHRTKRPDMQNPPSTHSRSYTRHAAREACFMFF